MTRIQQIGLMAAAVGAVALLMGGAQAQLPIGGVTRVASLSASHDGAAWAVTTDGRLIHCLFEAAEKHVRCYGRDGAIDSAY